MSFQLKEVLAAIGPAASIVFASWIFMGFLQQRYDAAYGRYQSLIADQRGHELDENRRRNIMEEVAIYKRRCELMIRATYLGLVAAILLIATLITGAIAVIFPHLALVSYLGTLMAVGGLALVIWAAVLVIRENGIIQRGISSELLDVPELAEATGQAPGNISDSKRRRR